MVEFADLEILGWESMPSGARKVEASRASQQQQQGLQQAGQQHQARQH